MTKLLLVGEAWGARESLFEHALVGYTGFELSKMLNETGLGPPIGIDHPSEYEMIAYWKRMREEFDTEIANVFNCRPPGNQIDNFFISPRDGGDTTLPAFKRGRYVRPELRFHVEDLWRKVDNLGPNLIVAFGNTACWALLGETKISALRGTLKKAPRSGIKVLPTYHPAAVLRQWNLRPIVLSDLEKASREVNSRDITRIERWLTVEPTLDEIAEWFTRPADFYAVDIENNSLITMIGFARTASDALVIPFFDDRTDENNKFLNPSGSYWPSIEAEMAAWRWVGLGLERNVPKIFQNGIYDLTHLLRVGFRPARCEHDTMLLHHALYPEMLKSLGFLGSIYSSEIAWKSMRTAGNNLKRDQ